MDFEALVEAVVEALVREPSLVNTKSCVELHQAITAASKQCAPSSSPDTPDARRAIHDDESTSDEEDLPPDDVVGADAFLALASRCNAPEDTIVLYTKAIDKTPSARLYAKRGEVHLTLGNNECALSDAQASLQINPDSVHGLRLRAMALHNSHKDSKRAYSDLCLAQSIDYDSKYDEAQKELRKRVSEETTKQECCAPSGGGTDPPSPSSGLPDFAAMMNNPQVMAMAQDLMKNPQMMQDMLKSFKT